MPVKTVAHTAGQPATGWSTGFDWEAPENRRTKEKFAADLDNMTKVAKMAAEIVALVDKLDTVLGDVQANDYVDRENLPPFPLPGTLASLKLPDLTVAFGAATSLLGWANTAYAFPQFDQETGDAIVSPPALKPIDVLRRVAKAGR